MVGKNGSDAVIGSKGLFGHGRPKNRGGVSTVDAAKRVGWEGILGKKRKTDDFGHRLVGHEKCVIFDFAGTVADTYEVALQMLREIAATRRINPSQRDIEDLRMMSVTEAIRKYKLSVLDMMFIGKKYEDGIYRQLVKLKVFRGLKPALAKLDHSYGMGIISSTRRENVAGFLHHNGLDKYFDFLETGSPVLGKPRRIRAIMKKHGYTKADVVYIGDEVRDIEAARKVGVKVIAVGWGINNPKRLKVEKPDFFVSRPSQLFAAVKKALNGRRKARRS
jgi:phosphoglycolate phosphatase-like HAD superfamily hydrolase